ncbi:MAG TPA: RlmE family RNA methyltransferase [Accumulibacter sp.]|uniref:RlmE family RNA methyltransferase n=1 Tax=Accumulibacter sp. TaxID=2053492 RepID=UPI00287830D6|nr:RlmE family RNA methyltransferase [Accumulibacter sp.]MDS4055678.1 RlmE family RNA methyltransferase [Accumulibacter sp.]HMV06202.1 RlmE family RNA methyltransferase [Accumulibacter sp.]HMW81723.1 RlmE family RNA methyltransferase [Accumulibacter sp.]HMX69164.1 RlmE family RNA methyltransferase [Accumulibacter sp.]HNB68906.1 RlmE family RNA methyltransferase [Accumulibacter sp.]
MKRSRSSNAWLREHVNDTFVQRARSEGYRSRAAYKLKEIDDKDHLIGPARIVVDLGASPGGWSQVVTERCARHGQVIALDLIAMKPLAGVTFLQGDFFEPQILDQLEKLLAGNKAGLVLSDMAPNISGIALCDQARVIALAELALDFAGRWLQPEGAFLVKVFHGHGFDDFRKKMSLAFKTIALRKPLASRDRSSEIYLLGRNPIAG